jgi:hypothetical protein
MYVKSIIGQTNLFEATGIPGFGRGGPCRGWHQTGEPEHLTKSLSPSSSLEFFLETCPTKILFCIKKALPAIKLSRLLHTSYFFKYDY